jgi:hypothetical protein
MLCHESESPSAIRPPPAGRQQKRHSADPLHRARKHDIGARQLPTGVSSSTLAVAMRQMRKRRSNGPGYRVGRK